MEILNGNWNVEGNSLLVVNEELIPGKLITLHAGHQLVCLVLDDQQFKRYQLQYFQYTGTNMCVFQQLLRSYTPRKLSLTTWTPLRLWEYHLREKHTTRISGRTILGKEVLSSYVRAVQFVTETHASVLTYSSRRDIWEAIPLWGNVDELEGFKLHCEQHLIPRNPVVDDHFMRHYRRI